MIINDSNGTYSNIARNDGPGFILSNGIERFELADNKWLVIETYGDIIHYERLSSPLFKETLVTKL